MLLESHARSKKSKAFHGTVRFGFTEPHRTVYDLPLTKTAPHRWRRIFEIKEFATVRARCGAGYTFLPFFFSKLTAPYEIKTKSAPHRTAPYRTVGFRKNEKNTTRFVATP